MSKTKKSDEASVRKTRTEATETAMDRAAAFSVYANIRMTMGLFACASVYAITTVALIVVNNAAVEAYWLLSGTGAFLSAGIWMAQIAQRPMFKNVRQTLTATSEGVSSSHEHSIMATDAPPPIGALKEKTPTGPIPLAS